MTLIDEDAPAALEQIPNHFNFVYLEAKIENGEGRKTGYYFEPMELALTTRLLNEVDAGLHS